MSTPIRKLFGTDGVRGEAGRFPLDQSTLRTVGASLASHLARARAAKNSNSSPLIIVGRDTRESGPWLEEALIDGAIEAGAQCQSAGVITTPGVAFLARSLPADAGVVISASHNPYQDNGFKIFAPSGRKLDDETERLIEADILAKQSMAPRDVPDTHLEKVSSQAEQSASTLQARYLEFLEKDIGAGLSLANYSLVIDTANGAASRLAPELFTRLGGRVTVINNEPDGRNINLNSGSLHIEELQQQVTATGADLGVAYDGDADRALFVDSHGRYVDGDAVLWVLSNYLQSRNQLPNGLVVATVMSNIGLEVALRSRGLQLVRTDVGDKYVLDELIRSGANLGGEQSGHIILPQLSLAGDGMITTLCLLRAMTEAEKSLHELTDGFTSYPQILMNVNVLEKRPFAEVEEIRNVIDETEAKLADKGRLLLRYSGTEPVARIMIEGDDQSTIEAYARNLATAIRETLGAR